MNQALCLALAYALSTCIFIVILEGVHWFIHSVFVEHVIRAR